MLLLDRRLDQELIIGQVTLRILEIKGEKVRIGFVAPQDVKIMRSEILSRNTPDEEKNQDS